MKKVAIAVFKKELPDASLDASVSKISPDSILYNVTILDSFLHIIRHKFPSSFAVQTFRKATSPSSWEQAEMRRQ